MTDPFDAKLAAIENAVVAEKNAEIDALTQQLEKYGKRSLGWMMTEVDRLTSELAAARPIVAAAKAWRAEFLRDPSAPLYPFTQRLDDAIDTALAQERR